jgi:hypothetical protein
METNTDAKINAKKLLTDIDGTTNPKNEKPLNINAPIEIFGTNTVKR